MDILENAPLGKNNSYITSYTPALLFPIPRLEKRSEIGVPKRLPFFGVDVWTGYEVSWLNLKGKPQVAIVQFTFPCESSHIIESKSFKLYLNSFNQTNFESKEAMQKVLQIDLSKRVCKEVKVEFMDTYPIKELSGISLDTLDIEVDTYQICPDFLSSEGEIIEETVCSNLLKSNCLVTGQPDWGSVRIHYIGPKINHEGLLKYIISFRQHNEFHEQCIERMFFDILTRCLPEKLTIHGRYTRRGGLDINPYRSNFETLEGSFRLARQ